MASAKLQHRFDAFHNLVRFPNLMRQREIGTAVINDAQQNGALYKGLYYWVLEPAALLMLAGLAFALLGFSLDRIFNPRLRGM